MSNEEWAPDPTGRFPYRLKIEGKWTASVSASPTGDPRASDPPGGVQARSIAPAPDPLAADKPRASSNAGWRILGAGLAVILIGGVIKVVYDQSQADDPGGDAIDRYVATYEPPARNEVEYCWYGTGSSIDVTFENSSGNSGQRDSLKNNQCVSMGTMGTGSFVYLSTQIGSSSGGTVECQIKVDGTIIERAESEGDYVIATCSGRV